jgi:hypothetical protein
MDNNDDIKYMDFESDNKIKDIKNNNIQFVHFATVQNCDDFVKYLATKQIDISHKCCFGIGCGIKKIKRYELDSLVEEYKQQEAV